MIFPKQSPSPLRFADDTTITSPEQPASRRSSFKETKGTLSVTVEPPITERAKCFPFLKHARAPASTAERLERDLEIIRQRLLRQLTNVEFHSSVANDNNAARNLGTRLSVAVAVTSDVASLDEVKTPSRKTGKHFSEMYHNCEKT